jgi:uncharacterized protein YndB with AHSA1/START domain
MTSQTITVRTRIAAPVEAAWAAFTTPADITQWNFASDDWRCPEAFVDLRVGGAHRARMEAKDGSFGFDLEGVYAEVEPHRAITLVLADGRMARTTFAPSGEAVEVTTVFDAETEHPIDMQRDGWQAILDSFARHVANGQRSNA